MGYVGHEVKNLGFVILSIIAVTNVLMTVQLGSIALLSQLVTALMLTVKS